MSGDFLLDDLKNIVRSGTGVLFIGAGVAISATGRAPDASWIGLLRSGVERCRKVGNPSVTEQWLNIVNAEIDSQDAEMLVSAAEKITTRLGKPEFARWIKDTVGQLKVSDDRLVKALLASGLPMITTNYDSILEQVSGFKPVSWTKLTDLEAILRNEENGIIHMHGYWEESDSLVFGIRSYLEVANAQHIQAVLRSLKTTKSFIFVGFGSSLTDPNFLQFFEWAGSIFKDSRYRNFRLVRSSELAEQTQIEKENRIYPIAYGDKHDDLAPFIGSLLKPITATIASVAPRATSSGSATVVPLKEPEPAKPAKEAAKPALGYNISVESNFLGRGFDTCKVNLSLENEGAVLWDHYSVRAVVSLDLLMPDMSYSYENKDDRTKETATFLISPSTVSISGLLPIRPLEKKFIGSIQILKPSPGNEGETAVDLHYWTEDGNKGRLAVTRGELSQSK